MKTLSGLSLLLVILLVSLSAYLRLSHSGIGCADWPDCYSRIGEAPSAQGEGWPLSTAEDAYRQLVEEKSEPLSWATPLHRLVASILGLLVLGLNVQAFRFRQHRVISLALLALTVWLAVLGIRSGSLHDPAVVMGNLVGGFSMLALLGWLWFGLLPAQPRIRMSALQAGLLPLALLLLVSQIVLGGLTSANFAATACTTLPDCNGHLWPGHELMDAFNLQVHAVDDTGHVEGGIERAAIHQVHRLAGALTAVAILLTGFLALVRGGAQRNIGAILVLLVGLEFGVGVASVLSGLPIILAVAHNWLAGLLLLALLRLLSLQRQHRVVAAGLKEKR